MFVLATARPEFRAPWATRSHHGLVSLVPLDRAQIRKMVVSLAERHALSKEVIDGVSERTGGVPLFVEEVTRLLLERRETGGGREIPPTLQQSLAARLDRLGDAREVAQIGAVLGREFSFALLRAVADRPEATLSAALEKLADADLMFVEGAGSEATYRFKHALIQDAAYDSLLKGRRQTLHRRAAEALVAFSGPQPELVARHFTQSGQTEPAIEWWGKAGDAALRRSAFPEAISHLGKAIEMADKEGGESESSGPKQLLKLRSDYGIAVMWSQGFAANEAKAAVKRIGDLEFRADHPGGRIVSGEIAWHLLRGEVQVSRQLAERFLQDAVAKGRPAKICIGRAQLGIACIFLGDFEAARNQYELVLGAQGAHDREARDKYGIDPGVVCRAELAFASWFLGDFHRMRHLIDDAVRLGHELTHLPSAIHAAVNHLVIEGLCNDFESVAAEAERLLEVCERLGVGVYTAAFRLYLDWARAQLGDPRSGAVDFRNSLATFERQPNRLGMPYLLGRLAELEAAAGDPERALASINRGLETAQESGQHYADAFLHKVRGDILLKRDPADPTLAADAYRTAIIVAKGQGARSYELLAALPLAKLLQTNNRPVEAHDALAPALEGFLPTPELAQIAEAQALLAALEATEAVTAAAARRRTRLKLQEKYGLALAYAKGFAAEETEAAFVRMSEFATSSSPDEKFAAYRGQIAAQFVRGEFRPARAAAETYLSEAAAIQQVREVGAAHRLVGLIAFEQGNFRDAQVHLEAAIADYDLNREAEVQVAVGPDRFCGAAGFLGITYWHLGDVRRAREYVDAAVQRALELDHVISIVIARAAQMILEVRRESPEAVVRAAQPVLELAEQLGMSFYLTFVETGGVWAKGLLADPRTGADELRDVLARYAKTGSKVGGAYNHAFLAQLELAAGDFSRALAEVEQGLFVAEETGEHIADPFLLRIRGDILSNCDPMELATAEEAFRTAITVARRQGDRSYELLAALPLAKLLQTNDRPVDAHDALARALEGFAPTRNCRRSPRRRRCSRHLKKPTRCGQIVVTAASA